MSMRPAKFTRDSMPSSRASARNAASHSPPPMSTRLHPDVAAIARSSTSKPLK